MCKKWRVVRGFYQLAALGELGIDIADFPRNATRLARGLVHRGLIGG